MAGASKKMDVYANLAAVKALESAANTLSYALFDFPFSIMDKMGLLINRVEYFFGSISQLNTTGDECIVGLIAAKSISDPTVQNDPVMLDSMKIERDDFGTAASGTINWQPLIKDFSALPGGGILVAPSPLSAFIKATGAAAACQCWIRMYYTYMSLSTEEYWQLVESRRIISS